MESRNEPGGRCTCPADPDGDEQGDPISTCPVHGWVAEPPRRWNDGWEKFVRTYPAADVDAKLAEHFDRWRGDGDGPFTDAGSFTAYGPLRAVTGLWAADVAAAGYTTHRPPVASIRRSEQFGHDGDQVVVSGEVHREVRTEPGCTILSRNEREAARRQRDAEVDTAAPPVVSAERIKIGPGALRYAIDGGELVPLGRTSEPVTVTVPSSGLPAWLPPPAPGGLFGISMRLDPCTECAAPLVVVNCKINSGERAVLWVDDDGLAHIRPHLRSCEQGKRERLRPAAEIVAGSLLAQMADRYGTGATPASGQQQEGPADPASVPQDGLTAPGE